MEIRNAIASWIETEDRNYTDAVVEAILQNSSNLKADPKRTSAIVSAATLLGRTLSMADIEPNFFEKTLNSKILYQIGFDFNMEGESVYYIDEQAEGTKLHRCASWDVYTQGTNMIANSDEANWFYRLIIATPKGTKTIVKAPSEKVLHFRINVDKNQPHRGRPFWVVAKDTAEAYANIEEQIKEEYGSSFGHVLPAPLTGIGDKNTKRITSDLKDAKGATLLVQSMAQGWGEGRNAGQSDWQSRRFGADPPQATATLREQLINSMLACAGVPPGLYGQAKIGGSGSQELYRQFLHGTLEPVAELITWECQSKLNPKFKIGFNRLMASDVSARARALGAMIQSGVDMTLALSLTGFDNDKSVIPLGEGNPEDQTNTDVSTK